MSPAGAGVGRRVVAAAVVWLAAALTVAPAAGQGGPVSRVAYMPPVVAPVVEPFRAPEHPYGPGNRGLKYGVRPGAEVVAAADGEVLFAGWVARELHVTVGHADGVRTSYSYLASVRVTVGQEVTAGDPLGSTTGRFHFGARRGEHYFDPATLFGHRSTEVELLPLEVPPGSTPELERERLALRELFRGGGGWDLSLPVLRMPSLSMPDIGAATDWLIEGGGTVGRRLVDLEPVTTGAGIARAALGHLLDPPPCTDGDGAAPSDGSRSVITVAGLGSGSESGSIDRLPFDQLGYEADEAVRFSYAGGQVPTGEGGVPPVAATSRYSSADTQRDLPTAGRYLADLVEDLAAARPDDQIDVYAHSMGGVVTRLALLELEDRGFPLERIGLVATLGTPHRGADLAGFVENVAAVPPGAWGLDVAEAVLGTGLAPDAVAVAQLAPGSPVLSRLAERGVPEGVDLVSVAARGDLVVPVPSTRVDGARNVTVPATGRSAHGDVVASATTMRELRLALGGLPARCVGLLDVVQDEVWGQHIAGVQGLAADVAGAVSLPSR